MYPWVRFQTMTVPDHTAASTDDYTSIMQLRAAYSHHIDVGNWVSWADLFAEDALCNFGFKEISGRDNVEEFGREFVEPRFEQSFHMAHMPVIELDGDEGIGAWYLHVYYERPESSGWILGRYDDEYTLTDDGWKFQTVTNEVHVDTGDLFDA